MLTNSFRELVKCRVREVFREPSAAFFVVAVPMLWMLILGFAFNKNGDYSYPIGILKEGSVFEQPIVIQNLIKASENDPHLKIFEGSTEELAHLFNRGTINLALAAKDGAIVFEFDPANREARESRLYVNDILQTGLGRSDFYKTIDQPRSRPGDRYIDFFIPGLLALSILTSSLFGTGMTIVAFRRNNLFKRFLATPISTYELFGSFIVGRFVILALEMTTILVFGWLVFDFHVAGSLLDYIIVSLVGTSAFTALAILMGSRLDNVGAYNGLVNLVTLPLMMLSGVFFSLTNFPDTLATVLRYFPLAALVDSLRQIALEGVSITALAPQLGVMVLVTVVCSVIGRAAFKWY